jgi:hypothetical protein
MTRAVRPRRVSLRPRRSTAIHSLGTLAKKVLKNVGLP